MPIRHLAVYLLAATAAGGAQAVDFADGSNHTISGFEDQIRVFDAGDGSATSVDLVAGADVGQVVLEGQSLLSIAPGAALDELIAGDDSHTSILGGTFPGAGGTYGSFDLTQRASLDLSDGSFLCSGGRCILASDDSRATIRGGTFGGSASFGLLAQDDAAVTITGGDFTAGTFSLASVRADRAVVDIGGGLFDVLQSLTGAVMTLYGSGFEVVYDGGGTQSGFFVIPEFEDGTISGTLADGSPLAVRFKTGNNAVIVLADAALVPLPGALWLLLSALGTLPVLRRRRGRARH